MTKRIHPAARLAAFTLCAAASLAGAAAQPAGAGWSGPGWNSGPWMGQGMMGQGVMGEGVMGEGMGGAMDNYPVTQGWGGKVLSYAEAQDYIAYGASHGTADAKANSVTFTGGDAVINLIAVQPGHDDQTFELHGLTNPTIIVPRGASVQLNLLNMDYGDNMEHTVVISAEPPPYPYMAMMYLAPLEAPPMPELPWRSSDNVKTAQYAALGETFVAGAAGTYWYVCPTPQHAEEGMYGKFIVR